MSAPVEYVSVRAFAKLDGCSDKLVRNAINDGKLPVSADGKVDPSLAGTGWRKGNRRAAAGADFGAQVPEKSARTTRRRSAGAKGSAPELDEIDPLELDDDIEVAEAVLFEQARAIRDAWMNWPSRVGPLIAAELGISPDPVLEALNKYVQQQLQDLGEPDADWAGADEG
jgi:hypothetical protein